MLSWVDSSRLPPSIFLLTLHCRPIAYFGCACAELVDFSHEGDRGKIQHVHEIGVELADAKVVGSRTRRLNLLKLVNRGAIGTRPRPCPPFALGLVQGGPELLRLGVRMRQKGQHTADPKLKRWLRKVAAELGMRRGGMVNVVALATSSVSDEKERRRRDTTDVDGAHGGTTGVAAIGWATDGGKLGDE